MQSRWKAGQTLNSRCLKNSCSSRSRNHSLRLPPASFRGGSTRRHPTEGNQRYARQAAHPWPWGRRRTQTLVMGRRL
jgi:hypothetical protein